MKKIEAIVRPHKLDDIKTKLEELGIYGMTISDVRGSGRQKGKTEFYRGAEYQISLIPKIKIEITVNDDQAENVIQAIQAAAVTGEIGDGKIFIIPVEETLRIRTGERGDKAV
jgi:nitrogen regulatory protein P-II 1